jgi:hypothetical protein
VYGASLSFYVLDWLTPKKDLKSTRRKKTWKYEGKSSINKEIWEQA